mgnify:FL=1|jgi:hypothetical protein
MRTIKLIEKLEWLIKENRKHEQNSIQSGKVEEYIQEYKAEFPGINNKNKNGEQHDKKNNIVDFTLGID